WNGLGRPLCVRLSGQRQRSGVVLVLFRVGQTRRDSPPALTLARLGLAQRPEPPLVLGLLPRPQLRLSAVLGGWLSGPAVQPPDLDGSSLGRPRLLLGLGLPALPLLAPF